VLPLRNTISDEMMLRYGAMQVDVFTLLAEARQKIAVNVAAADALRDFWLASADLSTAVSGGSGSAGTETASLAMPSSGQASGH
jgi:outer membrane protein TolC